MGLQIPNQIKEKVSTVFELFKTLVMNNDKWVS